MQHGNPLEIKRKIIEQQSERDCIHIRRISSEMLNKEQGSTGITTNHWNSRHNEALKTYGKRPQPRRDRGLPYIMNYLEMFNWFQNETGHFIILRRFAETSYRLGKVQGKISGYNYRRKRNPFTPISQLRGYTDDILRL